MGDPAAQVKTGIAFQGKGGVGTRSRRGLGRLGSGEKSNADAESMLIVTSVLLLPAFPQAGMLTLPPLSHPPPPTPNCIAAGARGQGTHNCAVKDTH